MSKRTYAEANAAIELRRDIINQKFDLPDATTAYIRFVTETLAACADKLTSADPALVPMNEGRLVAALDLLQQAKDTCCVAAIMGAETEKRKRAAAVAK